MIKRYEIKYQCGDNILLTTIDAPSELIARYQFYMEFGGVVDILDIKEVNKNERN